MGSKKKQTVGYKYFAGMHLVFCHGPIDRVREFFVDDDKKTLAPGLSQSGTITVDKPNLFGGENSSGGISGTFDQLMGESTQSKNSYLLSKLGALVPAYRGVVSAVLRQMYLGMSPYLKKIGITGTRIYKTTREGIEQWYAIKAAIISANSADVTLFTEYFETGDTSQYTVLAGSSAPFTVVSDDYGYAMQVVGFGTNVIERVIAEYPLVRMGCTFKIIDKGTNDFGSLFFYNAADAIAIGLYSGRESVQDPLQRPRFVYRNSGVLTEVVLHSAQLALDVWYRFDMSYDEGTQTVRAQLRDRATGAAVSAVLTITGVVLSEVASIQFKTEAAGDAGTTRFSEIELTAAEAPWMDMNPAHIIRECLTNTDWGMGYAEADVDDDAFTLAADALYAENMGISLLWDSSQSVEDFVTLICKHIDASIYVDRRTGKFVLKLIRADYDIADLLQLGVSNVMSVTDFSKPTFGELVNSATVTYWDYKVRGKATVTVSDIALASAQSGVVSSAVTYDGFTNGALATRVAERDLLALSTPRISCTIIANRDARNLTPGECFRLTWPDLEIDDVVMRVTGLAFGDGKSNAVRINCTEDAFSTPATAVIAEPPVPVDPTGADPEPATIRMAMEMPYWEAAQQYDQINVDAKLAASPNAGYVIASAARPTDNSINAELWVDAGAGYVVGPDLLDFCPHAELDGAIDKLVDELLVTAAAEVTTAVIGTWLLCDEEIMQVVDWDEDYRILTVRRGCLDTVPREHASGAALMFVDEFLETDDVEYTSGETLNVKILPRTSTDALALGDAPADSVTMAHRGIRPYPPANVQFNGEYWPAVIPSTSDILVTWVARNRLAQTGTTMLSWYDGTVAAEADTLYALRVLDASNNVLYEGLAITGLSHSIPASAITTADITIQLWTQREVTSAGGYESWQVVEHQASFGEALQTETAEDLMTEDDEVIFT